MRSGVKKLHLTNLDDAMSLFARCCEKDPYYQRLFGTADAYIDIKSSFRPDVENAILSGIALGYFKDRELVGLLLAINVNDWRNNHLDSYMHLFQSDRDIAEVWYQDIKTVFKNENSNLIYIFQLVVDEHMRMRKIATKLLESLLWKYGRKFTIFSDLSNAKANRLWTNKGFKNIRTKGGNNFVIKN